MGTRSGVEAGSVFEEARFLKLLTPGWVDGRVGIWIAYSNQKYPRKLFLSSLLLMKHCKNRIK